MKSTDFTKHLTRYLEHQLPRNLSENTVKSYRDTFKVFLRYCRDEKKLKIAKLSLKQLDARFIADFIAWQVKGAAPSTNVFPPYTRSLNT